MTEAGRPRVDLLAGYREAGVSRVMGLVRDSATTDEALESLVEDARAAGVEFAAVYVPLAQPSCATVETRRRRT